MPISLMTSATPAATATVASPWPFDSPRAKAIVPATPVTFSESSAVSVIRPFELVTCPSPPLFLIVAATVPSSVFHDAEPAPAIAPVVPVPRATEAATPTPSDEIPPPFVADRSMSPKASTVELSMDASTFRRSLTLPMPTPIARAPVLLVPPLNLEAA